MRALHTADTHTSAGAWGPIDPATGLHRRAQDFLDRLDEIGELAIEREVDLILHAGDLFHVRHPSMTILRETALRIRKWAETADVAIVAGNHELPIAEHLSGPVAVLAREVMDHPRIVAVEKPGWVTMAGAQIGLLPWQHRPFDLSKWELGVASGHEGPHILLAHAETPEVTWGGWKESGPTAPFVIIPAQLSDVWNYLALGHVHQYQQVWDSPPAVYPGSTERLDFSEQGETKGCVIVEFDGPSVSSYEFVPLEARWYTTIEFGPDTDLAMIPQDMIRRSVVRAIFSDGADEEAALEILKEAFWIASITKERPPRERARLAEGAHSMTPHDLVAAWADLTGVPKDKRVRLLEIAKTILTDGEN